MYNKKYIIEKIEEFHGHNRIYKNAEGKIAYPAYFNVGERGWFLLSEFEDDWFNEFMHTVHTSIVKDVEYTRGNQIIVTTQNTKFTFTLVMNN